MKIFIAAALLVFSTQAFAHGHQDGPCAKDREKFCAGIEPGEGRVMKCMKENKDKLSPECQAHREKMKKHMKEHMKEHHGEEKKQ